MRGVPYVAVTRGPLVESVHAVAACATDDAGAVALAVGDVDAPLYLRSTAKPFIAAEIVRSGTARRFGLDGREIAVIAASHGGEPFHVAAVGGILAKIGLGPEALQCGAHPPSYGPAAAALAAAGIAPSALHNNCSGKHAGMLAMCLHLGADPAIYLAAQHPVQRRILAFCARLCEEPLEGLVVGTDGCGMPVFATSLRHAARAFARFATLRGLPGADAAALGAVRDAMSAHPDYVAGSGRFDSALIERTRGRIVGKAGAEGVHGDALRDQGLGLALKVIDGNKRAVPPAVMALLGELGALEDSEGAALANFTQATVADVAGRPVGTIAARPDTIPVAGP